MILSIRTISKLAPGPLITVVMASGAVYLMGWTEQDLGLVGELPSFLPHLACRQLTLSQAGR
ncbi:MAG: hypothetical protein R3C45_21810 [Phycisphaerales bacterium]